MAKLAAVPDRRIDVEDARLADDRVVPDRDRPGVEVVGFGLVAEDDGVLAEDRVVADSDEVGAYGEGGGLDDGVMADACAEKPRPESRGRSVRAAVAQALDPFGNGMGVRGHN